MQCKSMHSAVKIQLILRRLLIDNIHSSSVGTGSPTCGSDAGGGGGVSGCIVSISGIME